MRVLVTGVAGFIGMHVARYLLSRGDLVVGLDNINDYYDIQLKIDRLSTLDTHPHFSFWQYDIANKGEVEKVFEADQFDCVVHLAAQAGVRFSLNHPDAYVHSNLTGFVNILEACRHYHIPNLVYASSSSVYGGNQKFPFSETDACDHPISLYAATKKSNELMAHVYSHLFELPTTGLRFFTVYGPWGRPDMAMYKFAEAILEDKPIDVYNNGESFRDFTYISDVVKAIIGFVDQPSTSTPKLSADKLNPSNSWAPYRLFNVGGSQPVQVNEMIELLETHLGKKAIRNSMPMQPGDVVSTECDDTKLRETLGFSPEISLESGIKQFADWFLPYHRKRRLYVSDYLDSNHSLN